MLEETLNLKFQLVTGYPGGAEQDLALERGEVHMPRDHYGGVFAREPFVSLVQKGFVRILIQTSRKRHPKMPEMPTLWEYMEKEKAAGGKSSLGASSRWASGGFGSWPIVSTPGITAGSLENSRATLMLKTLQEPDLLDEAKKRGWELRPVTAKIMATFAKEVSAQPADVVERMKKLMGE